MEPFVQWAGQSVQPTATTFFRTGFDAPHKGNTRGVLVAIFEMVQSPRRAHLLSMTQDDILWPPRASSVWLVQKTISVPEKDPSPQARPLQPQLTWLTSEKKNPIKLSSTHHLLNFSYCGRNER
jgi:hypothetical protein